MGSYKWGYKPSNRSSNYSYPTYNLTYIPMNLQIHSHSSSKHSSSARPVSLSSRYTWFSRKVLKTVWYPGKKHLRYVFFSSTLEHF